MALTQADKPMGLIEATLEDVKQQGLEQGREQGLEQGRELGIVEGIALEKREFVKKLWNLQEFSLEKVAILVDLPLEDVMAIIQDILQDEGLSQEEARLQIDSYQGDLVKNSFVLLILAQLARELIGQFHSYQTLYFNPLKTFTTTSSLGSN